MILVMLMFVALGLTAYSAEAAICPVGDASTVCVDWTEAAGGTLNLKETVVTISKNGVALAPIVVPATAPSGGGTGMATMPTVACESAAYTAKTYHNYTTTLGVMKSLDVAAVPVSGVLKDRTSEAACLKPPVNPTLH